MALVYVPLLGEGTTVWRAVQARHVQGSIYELLGIVPHDERWAFQPGQLVECEQRILSEGPELVATGAVPPNKSFKPNPLRGSA